jgi:Fe-S-cluster-containing dehydrogenase component
MSQYAIVTDLNRCVQCFACTVACKITNSVPATKFWNRVLRVGPTPVPGGSGHFPDVELYYLPLGCQHCENAPCVEVCPTGASMKLENGIVRIDPDTCIGCGLCVDACPYGVRYVDEDSNVAQKCKLCEEKVERGELPECVRQCGARARFFGDAEKGVETFVGPPLDDSENDFEPITSTSRPFTEDDIYRLPDDGNGPSFMYILRGRTWQGLDNTFDGR